ncbi:glycosyltransferase [Microbacterium sp. KUDC0406]|uniref:glycosyltransferase n=1 Tax=Microbacterium sp. KUDC0406 TaxID=2909588 RepID=UPI001F46C72E|nr:glycosyltransferase [Microbacterium sp. KUDC0406]UJP08894.1 glycosyltransferase [Microbacterium sp. KUDC0406]
MTRHPAQLPEDGAVVFRADSIPAPSGTDLSAAVGAVIIPAHDEAGVIARTLRSLERLRATPGVEVIVVCNGCTDDTARVARGFDGVRVDEIAQASKIAALNHGDEIATTWPRIYLDADIEVDPASIVAVFDAIAAGHVIAARPSFVYDAIGASIPVRSYYRARSRIPAPPRRLWGAGGYATGERGHARFGQFATVTADDSWFDAQFSDDEKTVVRTSPMRVRTPRDVAGLLAVLARQRRGYLELGISSHAGSRGRSLLASIRGPRSALDVGWYTLLTVMSRRRAERAMRMRGTRDWERDGSSRESGEGVL